MVDTKKLVSGFLLLASVMASLSFVFSGNLSAMTAQKSSAALSDKSAMLPAEQPSEIPKSAFLGNAGSVANTTSTPQVASINHPLVVPDNELPPMPDTTNLTVAFSAYVARTLLANNPDGPRMDADGNPHIYSPSADALAAAAEQVPLIKNFKAPDWLSEANNANLAILNNPSATDEQNYVEYLNNVFTQNFLQTNARSVFYSDPSTVDPSALSSAADAVGGALSGVKSATVPAPFAGFHKALLAALIIDNNTITTGMNVNDDPVKAMLTMRDEQKNVGTVVSNLQTQFQKSGLQQVIARMDPKKESALAVFVNGLFGIKTAYAQWPTWDLPTIGKWIDDDWKWVWQQIEDTLLQILKNQIILGLQNDVLNWVRNGFNGEPAFISNWKGYLENIGDQVAGSAIGDIVPELCSPFRVSIQAEIQSRYAITTQPYISSCRLSQVVNNITDFYNNFDNGRWFAFSATILPSGNYDGAWYIANQFVDQRALEAQGRANTQGTANHSFKNQVVCPYGEQQVDSVGDCQKTSDTCSQADQLDCGSGSYSACNWVPGKWVTDPNTGLQTQQGGSCVSTNGGKLDTTGGRATTVGDTIGNILVDTSNGASGAPHLTINAKNLVGLLTTMLESLATKFIQKAAF